MFVQSRPKKVLSVYQSQDFETPTFQGRHQRSVTEVDEKYSKMLHLPQINSETKKFQIKSIQKALFHKEAKLPSINLKKYRREVNLSQYQPPLDTVTRKGKFLFNTISIDV